MKKQNGFTLIELLVVIAIISLLLSIIMPALGRVKIAAQKIVCRNNCRQQAIGINVYAEENNSYLPNLGNTGSWLWDVCFNATNLIAEYAGFEDDSDVFFCAANKSKKATDARFWQYSWLYTSPPSGVGSKPFTNEVEIQDESNLTESQLNSLYRVPPYIYLFDHYDEEGVSILDAQLVDGRDADWPRRLTHIKNTGAREMFLDAVISEGNYTFFEIEGGGIYTMSGGTLTDNSNHKSNKNITNGNRKYSLPEGGNVVFFDGHAEWRNFDEMSHKYTSDSMRFYW